MTGKPLRYHRVFILALLLLLPGGLLRAAVPMGSDSTVAKRGWQFLGAPYVNADSDNGIVFGVATGLAHSPGTAYIVNGSLSSSGLAGLTWRGETGNDRMRYLLLTRAWLLPANLYPEQGALPDWTASARLQHTQLQFAALKRVTDHLEIGPEVWSDFAQGIDPEDRDGAPLDVATLPRFQTGSLLLGGLRGRYRTTSAVRPLDGVILDLALRGGRADGPGNAFPRWTVAGDAWAAIAKPLTPSTRLYLRGWFRYQAAAAPSVRNALGGVYTLRGQPFNRDYGRRLLAGRIQYHWTVLEHFTALGRLLHRVIPPLPAWDLEAEIAPFVDIGAVGDPDFGGWRRTRQGYGISFRLILPPELVFSFDLAITPGATPLYYFGGGESL